MGVAMKNTELAMWPESQPNWKEALLIALLFFFAIKSPNSQINALTMAVAAVLLARFIATSFFLFRFNMSKWGCKIAIDAENGAAEFQNQRGEKDRMIGLNFKKMPFSRLYFMRFQTRTDAKRQTLVVSEQEVEFLRGYLRAAN